MRRPEMEIKTKKENLLQREINSKFLKAQEKKLKKERETENKRKKVRLRNPLETDKNRLGNF